jgi:hypothetical protein
MTGSIDVPAGRAPGAVISSAPGPREGQFRIASCNLNFVLPAYLPCLVPSRVAGSARRLPTERLHVPLTPAGVDTAADGEDRRSSCGGGQFGGRAQIAGGQGRWPHVLLMGFSALAHNRKPLTWYFRRGHLSDVCWPSMGRLGG